MLPTGTITFLFTDIQGSTPLWERAPEKMAVALQVHNAALRRAIEANGGVVFKVVGDAFNAAFPTAPQALKAAIDGQRALGSAPWNELGPLKVRMGLHTGEAELDPGGDEYAVSHSKNRVSRVMSAAYGGQILLSQESADLVRRRLPDGVTLKDLGEHRLKGMEWPEHLYQVCVPGLSQDFPPLASGISHPNNLPVQRTSFIGRQAQVSEVKELLKEHTLVTLTGSGGVGKTRLSLQAAQELVDQFADGVWLVELAAVTDPGMVTQAVGSALELKSIGSQPIHEILLEYLHNRQVLLVIDNCEHLIEACAALADDLLRVCPKVKILASSREALGVVGEVPFRVPSLTLPDPHHLPELAALEQFEAVRLFAERARLARPEFQVSGQNAKAVTQICQRLDGIPLALELAAARLNVLTSEQLSQQLDNAFRLLSGGSRTALPRQQTLRATIDWSYRLLSLEEQGLLRRLSVFSGSFDLPAVEAVCCLEGSEKLDRLVLLASLANKSMLLAVRQSGLEMRYRLLETVRQYGREKLYDAGESQQVHESHAAYYLELAKQGGQNIFTRQAPVWLRRLEEDFPNIRVAFSWALEGEALEQCVEALHSLWWYWILRCITHEGYALLEKALSRVDAEHPSLARANLLHDLALLGVVFDTPERDEYSMVSREMFRALGDRRGYALTSMAPGFFEEGAAIFRELGDEESLAFHLWVWGLSTRDAGNLEQAELLLKESEHLYRKMGSWRLGAAYYDLGFLYFLKGKPQKARSLFQQALPLVQEVGDQWGVMWVKLYMGELEIAEAADEAGLHRAEAILLESLEIAHKVGHKEFIRRIPVLLAQIAQKRGEYAQAMSGLRDELNLFQGFGTKFVEDHHFEVGQYFLGLAEAAAFLDQAAYSARLLGALEEMRKHERGWNWEITPAKVKSVSELTRSKMDERDFQAAWEEGQAMTLEQAVAYALEVSDG